MNEDALSSAVGPGCDPSDLLYPKTAAKWVKREPDRPHTDTDPVNHPAHYETGAPFECIDVLMETQGAGAVEHFCLCNALKYLYRHRYKNGDEDIRKAKWYIDKYLELREL